MRIAAPIQQAAGRMWSNGEPIDPVDTIDQAVNGGLPWLEIQCARCKTPNDVDLALLRARSRKPSALSQVRQDREASVDNPAPVELAAAPPPRGGIEVAITAGIID